MADLMAQLRQAAAEGYQRCICGEFTIGIHGACRSMMTQHEYDRWAEAQDQLYAKLLG